MQRILHISSEYANELYAGENILLTEVFDCRGYSVYKIESENFSDICQFIYTYILKFCFKKDVFRFLQGMSLKEKNLIYLRLCSEKNIQKFSNVISTVTASSCIINPDGVYNFILVPLCDDIRELCMQKADEYFLQNQYIDFVDMLRFFAKMNSSDIDVIHVVMKSDYTADLYDCNMNLFDFSDIKNCEFAYVNEPPEFDSLISVLVELSPCKIILHKCVEFENSEIPRILTDIFEDRVEMCENCVFCDK